MKQLVVICLHGVLLLQSLISIQEIPVADEFDVTVQSYEHLAWWQECWKEYRIGGIPVIDSNKRLIGIVTNRDLRFENDGSKKVSQLMTSLNLITAKENTTMDEAELILQENKIEKLPVVNDNNTLIGLITYRDISKKRNKPIIDYQ